MRGLEVQEYGMSLFVSSAQPSAAPRSRQFPAYISQYVSITTAAFDSNSWLAGACSTLFCHKAFMVSWHGFTWRCAYHQRLMIGADSVPVFGAAQLQGWTILTICGCVADKLSWDGTQMALS